MIARDENVQRLADYAQQAIGRHGGEAARRAAARVYARLAERVGDTAERPGERIPVCRYLEGALAGMADGASPLPEIARAFAALDSRLHWARRKGASPSNRQFYDGHANAMIIGPGGLEQREDVMVGVSLMAPNTLYPDHNHPPEEVYLAFTDGEWWNAGMDWTQPGPGGLIYNPPGILHAMRSGEKPFLALWLLPL